ncbi:MAG: hypothetical protein RIR62_3374 [Pseudomonadota bacterium]
MPPDQLFQIANPLALSGWVALLLAPLAPRATLLWAGRAVPLALATLYTALVLAGWSGAEGGYGSLPDVMRLFDDPTIALAGWVHYLGFDLFVGAWAVETARREGIPHGLVIPCLLLVFLFGPAGFLAFMALRAARPAPARVMP